MNTSFSFDQNVTAQGFTAPSVDVFRTSGTENLAAQPALTTQTGAVTLTLPAASITTLVEP